MSQVKIKQFDPSLPFPAYQSPRAAAFDLVARVSVEIKPGQVERVPLNVAIQVPPNHWVLLAARSSLYKKGLTMINGIGIGDEDFAGNDDEYQAALQNFTTEPVTVQKGDRIAQAIVLPREQMELVAVSQLDQPNRGGFGSTG